MTHLSVLCALFKGVIVNGLMNKLRATCSMTFCFSFEVLKTLNPIQVNIKGGGPS